MEKSYTHDCSARPRAGLALKPKPQVNPQLPEPVGTRSAAYDRACPTVSAIFARRAPIGSGLGCSPGRVTSRLVLYLGVQLTADQDYRNR